MKPGLRFILAVLVVLPIVIIPACDGPTVLLNCPSTDKLLVLPGTKVGFQPLCISLQTGPLHVSQIELEDPPGGISYSFHDPDCGLLGGACVEADSQSTVPVINRRVSFAASGELKDGTTLGGSGSFFLSTVPLSVSPNADQANLAPGGSTTIHTNPKGGAPDYQCAWATDPSLSSTTVCDPIVKPSATTTYQVTVTDSVTVPHQSTVSATVTVSVAPSLEIVPNVTSMTQTNAASAIQAAGFVVGTITKQSSSTVAAGNVISQDPAAGTSAVPGSPVNLVISSGPSTNADLSVTITAVGNVNGTLIPNVGATGQQVTYTVTVTNAGSATATNVVVIDTYDSSLGTLLISSIPPFLTVNTCGTAGFSKVGCIIPTLQAGQSGTFIFLAYPASIGALGSTVTVFGDQPDPNMSNNTAKNSLLVEF